MCWSWIFVLSHVVWAARAFTLQWRLKKQKGVFCLLVLNSKKCWKLYWPWINTRIKQWSTYEDLNEKIDHGQGYSSFGVDHHNTGSHPMPRPDQSRQPSKVWILCFRFSHNSLMPCPFTGPKMFWACPNFLCQTKNLFTYCSSHKHFVPDKNMICSQ